MRLRVRARLEDRREIPKEFRLYKKESKPKQYVLVFATSGMDGKLLISEDPVVSGKSYNDLVQGIDKESQTSPNQFD